MPSEFSSLLDICIQSGISHSDLLQRIHTKILAAFKTSYPDAPISTTPIIDEETGIVHLLQQGKDITPKEFRETANSLARQVLIEQLSTRPEKFGVQHQPHYPPIKMATVSESVPPVLFWGYNMLFGFYNFVFGLWMVFLGPFLGLSRSLPWQSMGWFPLIGMFILLILPFITMAIVVKEKLSQVPGMLLKIVFLVEAPIVLFTLPLVLSNSFIGSLTPGMGILWLICLTLPIIFATADQNKFDNSLWMLILRSIGLFIIGYFALILVAVMPIYLSDLFSGVSNSFYAMLTSQGAATGYTSPISMYLSPYTLLVMLFIVLAVIGGILIALLPFVLVALFSHLFYQSFKAVVKSKGMKQTTLLSLAPIIAIVILFQLFSMPMLRQSPLEELASFHTLTSFEEKMNVAQRLVGKKNEIEAGIRTMSQSYQRSSIQYEGTYWQNRYEQKLRLSKDTAAGLEAILSVIVRPLFIGAKPTIGNTLYQNYERVFGLAYGASVPVTTSGNKNVSIVTREIRAKVTPTNPFAEVSYSEEYRNNTSTEQEVIYEFSLPTDAVITDLDLGPELEFQGEIAPRGAARRTYEQQIVRRRDPALIEQVGPRQYRLRVYPIPPPSDRVTLGGRNQKIRFTYTVPLAYAGIPLPVFSKKQNMTEENLVQTAFINDIGTQVNQEQAIIATDIGKTIYCSQLFPSEERVIADKTYRLEPRTDTGACQGKGRNLVTTLDKRVALVIDTSFQNGTSLNKYIQQLVEQESTFFDSGNVDVYFANGNGLSDIQTQSTLKNLSPDLFFGKPPTVNELRNIPGNYDAILLLTGGAQPFTNTTYDERGVNIRTPLFVFHVFGQIPSYPDAVTSTIIQSGGNVVSSLSEFSATLPVRYRSNELLLNQWTKIVGEPLQVSAPLTDMRILVPQRSGVSPFEATVGKASIYKLIQSYPGGDIWSDIPYLDKLQQTAKAFGIVTPFSSSLALVNIGQQLQLNQEQQGVNRFEVEQPDVPVSGGGIINIRPENASIISLPRLINFEINELSGGTGVKLNSYSSSRYNNYSLIPFVLVGSFILGNVVLVLVGVIGLLKKKNKK